jgi:outer membrane protein assembly factor BamA
MELSGIEILALNELTNVIRGSRKEFVLGRKNALDEDVVNFSHYAKGELDLIYTRDFSQSSQFAFKLNIGIASPFGGYTRQVPYLKQFFVGGALSNRAWQIRELGPGSYQDLTPTNQYLPFYQTGDFKIDMSAELRFDIIWYFKGAIFVDAANVWTLNENDATRPGAELSHNFYKEFGIGYGFGIRLDLDFFIIRLDFGYKLHNPYPVDDSRWLKKNLKQFPGGAEPQIAVGLPF